MKILEKIEWTILNDYIEKKLIVANKHPKYNIWILNYTPTTQFERTWDDYTLSCRGLVIDGNGNILARPFRKFKNYEEHDPSEIDLTQAYEVFEKMDGSLGILFYYEAEKEWIFATRGSFTSEQSIVGRKMIQNSAKLSINDLLTHCTYLFEIIYPENRIVVNYGDDRKLVLLTVVETKTGIEFPYDDMKLIYSDKFTIVKKYDVNKIEDLNELRKLEEDNKEGFVVKFPDGFRVKVKLYEYCRLHSIITNVSNLSVWRALMNHDDLEVLTANVPDEFYNWLKKTILLLHNAYNEIERLAMKEFFEIYYQVDINNRKEFAEKALKARYTGIIFSLLDKKKYEINIWKLIRPTFSKPFKDGYDSD